MNILVCIKQVPETTEVKIDPETGTLLREGVKAVVNPFDMYAIEEGIRLKEKHGGKAIAITMGPPQAESALRDAIALGCDDAILLSDKAFAGADTLATSYTLACAIRKIGAFDLIICGLKTTDGDTGQVGPGLAEQLGIPHVCYLRKIIEIKKSNMRVERFIGDGYEIIDVFLPCLITVTKEINEPRFPSLKGKIKAKKAQIPTWMARDLGGDVKRFGLNGSATRVIKIFHPAPPSKGEIILGDPSAQAEKLVQKLRELKML